MNLLLLFPEDLVAHDRALLSGRRLRHVLSVHRAAVGDTLRVGLLDGLMGEGRITRLDADALGLELSLDQPPPPRLPVTLLLALPRPKMLRRIFQHAAVTGVSRLVLINSYRVEKSFWESPFLQPDAIRQELVLGAEQGRDTVLPEVVLEPRFKPFVEDRLPAMAAGARRLLAHPAGSGACPVALNAPVSLAVGPEGGFIPYEVAALQAQGFEAVHLGPRILRVETAVTALLARLYV